MVIPDGSSSYLTTAVGNRAYEWYRVPYVQIQYVPLYSLERRMVGSRSAVSLKNLTHPVLCVSLVQRWESLRTWHIKWRTASGATSAWSQGDSTNNRTNIAEVKYNGL